MVLVPEPDLKLTRLIAIISPFLAKLRKHYKMKTAFVRETLFTRFYLPEAT